MDYALTGRLGLGPIDQVAYVVEDMDRALHAAPLRNEAIDPWRWRALLRQRRGWR